MINVLNIAIISSLLLSFNATATLIFMEHIDESQSVFWLHVHLNSDYLQSSQRDNGAVNTQSYFTNQVNLGSPTQRKRNSSITVLDTVIATSSNNSDLYSPDLGKLELPVNIDIVKEWFLSSGSQTNLLSDWKKYVDDIVYENQTYGVSTSSQDYNAFYHDSFFDWQIIEGSGLLTWAKVFVAVILVLLGFVTYIRNQPSDRIRSRR
ncbi:MULTISPECIES: hypothetical protein [Vibrio]|uniref:hypothetical protein n=1 Tax=Vibrio TaxID=662 RepID=UPI000BFFAEC7|nr:MULTISPECIES: hypothetical protein [unclassified Vibrio]PHJ41834.1 hypothetical protein AK965_09065 [Vibrio sp. PID17_43]RIZ53026.1 hypothetical protein AK966_14475 [Vibrio sp. PID23_8]